MLTNIKLHLNYQFQQNLLRPGIIDARAWYWAVARWLRNTDVDDSSSDDEMLNCDYFTEWRVSYFVLQ